MATDIKPQIEIPFNTRSIEAFSKEGLEYRQAERINQFFKPERRSLIFLSNLTRNLDQIAAGKNDFDRIFGRSLTSEEIKYMSDLGVYQQGYLQ